MHNYKLLIAYDGTAYHGWQMQPNGLSIQELVQKKLAIILRQDVFLTASGRTDAGVHAKGQVAHFHFPVAVDLRRLQKSLNGLLPLDIRILSALEVPLSFHARYSAKGKIYHYHLHLDRVQNPFQRLYSLHVQEKIDLARLKAACDALIGTHSFLSFANEGHLGSASRDAVRTLHRLDIVEQEGGVRLEFEADGFLYKMVRNLTGTLLELAKSKAGISEDPAYTIEKILKAQDRRSAGKAAPPHGLFLIHVAY